MLGLIDMWHLTYSCRQPFKRAVQFVIVKRFACVKVIAHPKMNSLTCHSKPLKTSVHLQNANNRNVCFCYDTFLGFPDLWVSHLYGDHTGHRKHHLGAERRQQLLGVSSVEGTHDQCSLLWLPDLLVLRYHPQHCCTHLTLC